MKTKISVAALVAAVMLTMSLSLPQAFGADEVKAALKGEAIDSSKLSPEMAEIAKLVQSGVDEAVVLAFIEKNALQRSPTADGLIELQRLGLSSKTMVALMNSVKKPAAPAQVASELRQFAAAQGSVPATVVSPQVIYTQPPTVYVPPPVVYEPAWSYPVFSFGLDFGHHVLGHVFGHHGGGHYGFGHHGGGHGRHH